MTSELKSSDTYFSLTFVRNIMLKTTIFIQRTIETKEFREFARFFQTEYKSEQPLLDVHASVAGALTVCEGTRVHLDCLYLDNVRAALQ